ncbi:MAG: glycoside hydrolase family 15 protein, partial [Actinomycetota bacterium]
MSTLPIADYALISDSHSAALVSRDGSIDWLCFPRFDSPSVFAHLLDDQGGAWSIRPLGTVESSRRYIEDTMVLETTFRTAGGTVVVTDALAVGRNEGGHDLGAHSPHVLLRTIDCTEGTAEVEIEFSPRPEYALIAPLLSSIDGGIASRGGAHVLVLSSPVDMSIDGCDARARVGLEEGNSLSFALHHRNSWEEAPAPWSQEEISGRLLDTIEAWQTWSSMHQSYEGPWRDLVHQSGRVLQALTYQPTGAIVAAATTSLPEEIGGERNWDYR